MFPKCLKDYISKNGGKDMFDNISGKIKGLAVFLAYACVICGIIITIIGAINFFANIDFLEYANAYGGSSYSSFNRLGNQAYNGLQLLKYGIVVGVGGTLSTIPLYGFGELIEKVSIIADKIKCENN
jgi:hypothetical protein